MWRLGVCGASSETGARRNPRAKHAASSTFQCANGPGKRKEWRSAFWVDVGIFSYFILALKNLVCRGLGILVFEVRGGQRAALRRRLSAVWQANPRRPKGPINPHKHSGVRRYKHRAMPRQMPRQMPRSTENWFRGRSGTA